MVDLTTSHYSTGTATVAANGTVVTFQGAGNIGNAVRAGDLFGTHVGSPVRISEVGPASGLTASQARLAYPWKGPAQTAAAYEIQLTPYDVGYRKAIEDLVTGISEGNLPLLAALAGAPNKLPYFDSANSMALTDISPFARTLLDDADGPAMYGTLGVVPDGQLSPRIKAVPPGTYDNANAIPLEFGITSLVSNSLNAPNAGFLSVLTIPFSANAARQFASTVNTAAGVQRTWIRDVNTNSAVQRSAWREIPSIEDGSWTPNFVGATTPGNFQYDVRGGSYVKVGNLVFIHGSVRTAAIVSPGAGNLYVSGLPFAIAPNDQSLGVAFASSFGGIPGNFTGWSPVAHGGGPGGVLIRYSTTIGSLGNYDASHLTSSSFMILSGVYRTTP